MLESLRRRFELAATEITVGGRLFRLARPRSVDELISEEDFAIDDRIPYWAECWPSARVLAVRLACQRGDGRTLLELGCGIGLPSLVAAAAGFEVLATDYYADALEFTTANAEAHEIAGVDTRLIDWRKLPDDLGTFDVVVAADVLYERPLAALVARTIAATLAPDGLALITDPIRRPADAFADACQAVGLSAELVDLIPLGDGPSDLTVSLIEVRHCQPAGISSGQS